MEPVWLGVVGTSLASAVSSAAQKATKPFAAALDTALDLIDGDDPLPQDHSTLDPSKDPHTLLLAEVLTGHPLVGDEAELSIDDIRLHSEELQQRLQLQIGELLDGLGIKGDAVFSMSVSADDGAIELYGDSPHLKAIERALNEDKQLAADFRRLSALQSLVAAADASSEFVDAYSENPYSAVASFAELFEDSPSVTLLRTDFATDIRFEA